MSIPTRLNFQRIEASWFNTIRDAIASITNTTKIVNSSYTLLGADSIVQVTAMAPVIITLPIAFDAKDKKYTIKIREAGNDTAALISSVTLKAQAGEFIDGLNEVEFLENLQSIDVVSNGVEWVTI